MQQNVSEVAAIREQIAVEHMAAKLGLQGLNVGNARHSFITARLENMGTLHEKLRGLVGERAIALVSETLDAVPETLARSDILAVVRRGLDSSEETERLCDDLQGIWKAIDLLNAPVDLSSVAAFTGVSLLRERFGDETACKLIFAPSSSHVKEIPPS
jgi:hypothetical protein